MVRKSGDVRNMVDGGHRSIADADRLVQWQFLRPFSIRWHSGSRKPRAQNILLGPFMPAACSDKCSKLGHVN